MRNALPDRPYRDHLSGWHFNAAFGDGSAREIKMKSYERMELPNLPPWCGTARTCWCLIVRGPGWQIDTMPAPAVQTNHACPNSGRPSQDGVNIAGWHN
jgi:hypothetical protein